MTDISPKAKRASSIAALINAISTLEYAYSRWIFQTSEKTPMKPNAEVQMQSALAAIYDDGPEKDDQECKLLATLRAMEGDLSLLDRIN